MLGGDGAYHSIVKELKDGDRSGARHLDERYRTSLVNEATHASGVCRQDAEEIVNDVLLTVICKIHTFTFRSSGADFHRWVNAIFRNRIRDYHRSASLQAAALLPLSAAETDNGADVFFPTGDVEEKRDAINDALDTLRPWERILLWCRARDVAYREIEQYTGKKASTLRALNARVQRKFASAVERRLQRVNSEDAGRKQEETTPETLCRD